MIGYRKTDAATARARAIDRRNIKNQPARTAAGRSRSATHKVKVIRGSAGVSSKSATNRGKHTRQTALQTNSVPPQKRPIWLSLPCHARTFQAI